MRTRALVGFGRPGEAIEELRRGIQLYPDSAHLWGALAQVAFQQGDSATARDAADRALGIEPGHRWAMVVRSVLYGEAADLRTGLALAARVVTENPDWAIGHSNLGYLLSYAGVTRYAEARREVLTAIELEPEDSDHYRVASGVFRRIGDHVGAQKILDDALDLAPTDERLLLMRAAYAPGGNVEAAGILSSVLAQNPQQRQAARGLTTMVWTRLTTIAGTALWFGPAVAIAFRPAPLDPLGEAITQLVVTLAGVLTVAGALFGRLRSKLPKRFVGALLARSSHGRLGLLLAVTAPLGFLAGAVLPGAPLAGVFVFAILAGAGRVVVERAWNHSDRDAGRFTELAEWREAERFRGRRLRAAGLGSLYVGGVFVLAPAFAGRPVPAEALIAIGAPGVALVGALAVSAVLAHTQVRRTRGLPAFDALFPVLATAFGILPALLGIAIAVTPVAPRPSPTVDDGFTPPVILGPDVEVTDLDFPDFDIPDFPEIVIPTEGATEGG